MTNPKQAPEAHGPICDKPECGAALVRLRHGSAGFSWYCPRDDDAHRLCAQLAERGARIAELEAHLRRVIGDHNAPRDCYSTGPMTGDPILDLVICPSCSAMEFLAREEQRKKETK